MKKIFSLMAACLILSFVVFAEPTSGDHPTYKEYMWRPVSCTPYAVNYWDGYSSANSQFAGSHLGFQRVNPSDDNYNIFNVAPQRSDFLILENDAFRPYFYRDHQTYTIHEYNNFDLTKGRHFSDWFGNYDALIFHEVYGYQFNVSSARDFHLIVRVGGSGYGACYARFYDREFNLLATVPYVDAGSDSTYHYWSFDYDSGSYDPYYVSLDFVTVGQWRVPYPSNSDFDLSVQMSLEAYMPYEGGSGGGVIPPAPGPMQSELLDNMSKYDEIESSLLNGFNAAYGGISDSLTFSYTNIASTVSLISMVMTNTFNGLGSFNLFIYLPLIFGVLLFFIGRGSSITSNIGSNHSKSNSGHKSNNSA